MAKITLKKDQSLCIPFLKREEVEIKKHPSRGGGARWVLIRETGREEECQSPDIQGIGRRRVP